MGYTNLPPTVFDQIKSLETRLNKLENFGNLNKVYAMAAGSGSVTTVSGTPWSLGVAFVTFPVDRFTAIPNVTITGASAASFQIVFQTSNADYTGFTVRGSVYETIAAVLTFSWIAVQMTSTNANG